jgi:hypothetical protein
MELIHNNLMKLGGSLDDVPQKKKKEGITLELDEK